MTAARALFFGFLALACEPDVAVGTWSCPWPPRVSDVDGGALAPEKGPVAVPWASGFEDGVCDYNRALGFCYARPDANYAVVAAPVHAGHAAIAFTVTSDPAKDGEESRCVREGALPVDARYGAWFYVPTLATTAGNWNLMYFPGSADGTTLHGLWDVSLANATDGGLYLYLFDHLRQQRRTPQPLTEIPIGAWFHVEFRWLRAADATGEVDLYQDDQPLLTLKGLQTDTSSVWAQWYVGSLTDSLSPASATIYVDDVGIRASP